MNKRMLYVGIGLGIIIAIVFFLGSPMFGGFDMNR